MRFVSTTVCAMETEIGMNADISQKQVNESFVQSTMNLYFKNKGILDKEEKVRLISRLIEDDRKQDGNDPDRPSNKIMWVQ